MFYGVPVLFTIVHQYLSTCSDISLSLQEHPETIFHVSRIIHNTLYSLKSTGVVCETGFRFFKWLRIDDMIALYVEYVGVRSVFMIYLFPGGDPSFIFGNTGPFSYRL